MRRTVPAAAGGTVPAEREARSQLVAGFNRLCEIVVRSVSGISEGVQQGFKEDLESLMT